MAKGLECCWVHSRLGRDRGPDKDQHKEFWNIFNDCPLHDSLLEYYTRKKSVETNILAVRQDGTSIDDVDDDFDDSHGEGVTANK